MSSEVALLFQNARFHEAFERADLNTLEKLWSHDDHVKCIHPGWTILEDWTTIRQSWDRIFVQGPTMSISLRNVSAKVHGSIGVVVLIEEIIFKTGTSRKLGAVMATNLFEFDGREWKMIHHHGSPMIVENKKEKGHYRLN